jgi:hypothetical protein
LSEKFPTTNTLAYFDPQSVTKQKKVLSFCHLANMEIIEYEFEDPNMSLKDLGILDRSLSLTDLRQGEEEESEDGEVIFVALRRSA